MTDNVIEFPNQERIEEEACRWILRLDNQKSLSADEIDALNTWIKQSDRHKQSLVELAQSWSDMDLLSELAIPHEAEVPSAHPTASNTSSIRHYTAAAACFLLCVGLLSVWQWPQTGTLPTREAAATTLQVALGQTEQYDLADGSQVWLNTQTTVETDFNADKRELTLIEGEAHFAVEKDQDRPFEVNAGRYIVRAVGTAFSVRLFGEKIQVTVTEGIVDVIDTQRGVKTTEREQLHAGQTAIIDTNPTAAAVLDTLAETEMQRRLSWREGRLIFAGESLQTVVEEVSRYTAIVIEVDGDTLKQTRIGGQFKAGKTDELFDVLESGFGLHVTWLSEHHVKIHEREK